MENPNDNGGHFSQNSALYNGNQRGYGGGGNGEPMDPQAFDRDCEHKEKLLKKWDRYFPHES